MAGCYWPGRAAMGAEVIDFGAYQGARTNKAQHSRAQQRKEQGGLKLADDEGKRRQWQGVEESKKTRPIA